MDMLIFCIMEIFLLAFNREWTPHGRLSVIAFRCVVRAEYIHLLSKSHFQHSVGNSQYSYCCQRIAVFEGKAAITLKYYYTCSMSFHSEPIHKTDNQNHTSQSCLGCCWHTGGGGGREGIQCEVGKAHWEFLFWPLRGTTKGVVQAPSDP